VNADLLLGDEAAAQAALDAGIGGAFSYPGTPATEIFECIQERAAAGAASVSALWSANEKVAYEEALGMSYAGRRALVSMKHVGLNVAADPFMSSAITGVNAGLVLVVGDDPGMHSSQNEQDTRYYHEFAHLPLFEPGNQQQVYDLVREAFEYSEDVGLPVMVRLVTRLCHSRSTCRHPRADPEHRRPGKRAGTGPIPTTGCWSPPTLAAATDACWTCSPV
jgi:indolepyruvate ferredoxin oxidoreductase alpha subunit